MIDTRNTFEQIYAERHNIEDIQSLVNLRNGESYDDEHLDDCWFYFKAGA